MYVHSIETKTTSDGQGRDPEVVKETVATALVEGNNILGDHTKHSVPLKIKLSYTL